MGLRFSLGERGVNAGSNHNFPVVCVAIHGNESPALTPRSPKLNRRGHAGGGRECMFIGSVWASSLYVLCLFLFWGWSLEINWVGLGWAWLG